MIAHQVATAEALGLNIGAPMKLLVRRLFEAFEYDPDAALDRMIAGYEESIAADQRFLAELKALKGEE
jgi:hypothetical protein